MPRLQFNLRTLFWLTVVGAAFLGGIRLGRELQKRADETPQFWDGGVEYWPMTEEFDRQRGEAERKYWESKRGAWKDGP